MAVSEAKLAALRAQADHLRSEIRAFRTEGEGARLEADRDAQAEALQAEIKRLEAETVDAARAGGGSVEDAMAAMERAEQLHQMMMPADEEEAAAQDEQTDGEQPVDRPGDAASLAVVAPDAEAPVTVASVADRPAVGETAEGDK
jgi:hypothetical protein